MKKTVVLFEITDDARAHPGFPVSRYAGKHRIVLHPAKHVPWMYERRGEDAMGDPQWYVPGDYMALDHTVLSFVLGRALAHDPKKALETSDGVLVFDLGSFKAEDLYTPVEPITVRGE